ncbi:hypothetical protein FRB96_002041 [Tulasnella sp. 330]|nr:hypothetical protein FRB96_002041 [Tulasnella sp. 330]KAG8877440.1 hypothetical protein FRB97_003401 [Tulasnella sp. 331]
MAGNGSRTAQHVSFVLLAEFDIDQGSVLSHEYPYPTGMDEQLLADLMIPDGVHEQTEDWTIFFLNQTPGNTISSIFTPGDEEEEEADDKKDLLYVLNLVRTKHDKSVKRGAVVKALAICTHHPCIQIFKPILLIALEDYYVDPSVECLVRLFDAINSMDISLAPTLSRDEKLVLRVSERRDIFAEKFASRQALSQGHQRSASDSSNILAKTTDTRKLSLSRAENHPPQSTPGHQRSTSSSVAKQLRSSSPGLSLNSEVSDDEGRPLSNGGSAIWVGESETVEGLPNPTKMETNTDVRSSESGHSQRPDDPDRKSSMDQLSVTSSLGQIREQSTPTSLDSHRLSAQHPQHHRHIVRDTHFFETSVLYNGHNLPIKLPVSTFPEEIGDYSLIQLIQTFTSPTATISGPAHPHLHTNGMQTPPLMLLFNALITQKRIIFLGYGRPAGHVSNFVLAACALGSGCGCHLRGFAERAFPYTNLSNKAVVEAVPGFIAGVKNPIFESLPMWDVLCHTDTGKIVVHRDISSVPPPISSFPTPPSLNVRGGAVVFQGDEDGKMAASMMIGAGGVAGPIGPGVRPDQGTKLENYDSMFVDDLTAAVAQHFGETMIRARVAEYVSRFIRIAACYEETAFGTTSIGFPTQPFSETGVSSAMGIPQGFCGSLGSGMVFGDEVSSSKEMSWNASRVEGWRLTRSYEYLQQDFQVWLETRPIKKMDIKHQISRLRYAKAVSDSEMDLIMHTMSEDVRTYEQIVELLSHLPPHAGGLLPVTFGLFHSIAPIRDATVDLLNIIRSQPIGNHFVSNLNAFHRFAYIQILENRKREQQAQVRQQEQLSSQHHQQAQIAQQLFAAATTVVDQGSGQFGTKPPTSSATSLKSKRETASGFVSHLFSGTSGSSNGGHSSSVSRSGSMHRPAGGGSGGPSAF